MVTKVLKAIVIPAPMKNVGYDFLLDGWRSLGNHAMTMHFEKEVNSGMSTKELSNCITQLNNICLAMFVNDFYPRKILSFEFERKAQEFPQTEENIFGFKLGGIFGFFEYPKKSIEQDAANAFVRSGWIFNAEKNDDLLQLPPVAKIQEWYHFFKKNSGISKSVSLMQEAFGSTNELFNSPGYLDYYKLTNTIVLLVSGLEGLFRSKDEDNSDISFKFSTLGALFYKQYVTSDFLNQFHSTEIFNSKNFQTILRSLYKIRSDIAHGSHKIVESTKFWNKFFILTRVGVVDPTNSFGLFRNILFSLGLLQKHFLAIVVQSKDNLARGTDILDDVLG